MAGFHEADRRSHMLRTPAIAAALLAFPVLAQQLTPEAKDSPYRELWMTLHGPQGATDSIYQGSHRLVGLGFTEEVIDLSGEWVDRFEAVPEAQRLAQRAHAWRRAYTGMFWASMAALATGAGMFLATSRFGAAGLTPSTTVLLLSTGIVAASLEVAGLLAGRRWRSLLMNAVRLFNTTLNNRLPPEERFELGEVGLR